MSLTLRPLRAGDETQARAAHAELAAEGFEFLLDLGDRRFDDYLDLLERQREGRDLAPGRVPATFLVAVVADDLVGRVSLRHELNDRLARVGGHIGYAVRPGFRQRGHGTEILRQALGRAASLGLERALVTCDDMNTASAAVIEACGGVPDGVTLTAEGTRSRRYWIPTSP